MKLYATAIVFVSLLALGVESTHCQDAAEVEGKVDTLMQLSAVDSTALDSIKAIIEAGNYPEAEALARELLATIEADQGDSSCAAGVVLDKLVSALWRGGKARDPETQALGERAIRLREMCLGPDHLEIAESLKNLGDIFAIQRKSAEAESLYVRALEIREIALGPDHMDVAPLINNLAMLYQASGRYAETESMYLRALSIWEKGLGPDHPDVARALANLGNLYAAQQQWAIAEPLFLRATAIREKAFGPEHPYVAAAYFDLARVYCNQGNFTEAERLDRRALTTWEKAFGPEHREVANGLHNLAVDLYEQGRYAEAEPLYRQALSIREEALGPAHPDVANNLNSLAVLCARMGRVEEAVRLQERGLAIVEEILGPDHYYAAVSLQNLATHYSNLGRDTEAEPLYLRALAIQETATGPEHPEVAGILVSLGNLYSYQDRASETDSLYRRALAIRENALGREHPEVAIILHNLGESCAKQGRYAEAEQFHKRALEIRSDALGPDHWMTAQSFESMAKLYRLQGDFARALESAERGVTIRRKNFWRNADVLSEMDALSYKQALLRSSSRYLRCFIDASPDDSLAITEAADIILASKGQVSDGVLERQQARVTETDSATVALAESLRMTKHDLSRAFVEGPQGDIGAHRSQIDSLSELANSQEAELARHSASYRSHLDNINVSFDRIAAILPEKTTLVEYIWYFYEQLTPDSAVFHYLALLVGGDNKLVIVDLGEAAEIDPLVDRYRKHMLSISSSGGQPSVVDAEDYRHISSTLYDKIWKPIADHLVDKDLVLIAADGGLNMLSFAGLANDDGQYLIEKHAIHYLSSGRDLIRLQDTAVSATGLFALGDPDYDATVLARLPDREIPQDTSEQVLYAGIRGARSGCGSLNEIMLGPLPGTRQEVEQITASWQESQSEPLATYFGPDASEENVKAAAPGHRVIHLATHGYFLQGKCLSRVPRRQLDFETDYVGENPLLLSGLFLAGANLHGEGCDEVHAEDGILTAYEVSEMDLDGTELVVLSACETGLGEVKEGEGVYGLRRAFQMAGARTVISALWPVADEATAELLGGLYNRPTESLAEAMRAMQLEKINKLRENNQPDHPFAWGAFLVIGDWK